MTANKQQQNPRRRNGNLNGTRLRQEKAVPRAGVCRAVGAANGKLAGILDSAGPEVQSPATPVPIWFAALMATQCQAKANGEDRDVRWDCVSGRAVYTNRGPEMEVIEPLGVCLQGGHTLAVSWIPGETAYTVEVFRQFGCVA